MRRASILVFLGLLALLPISASAAPQVNLIASSNTFWVFPSGDESGETDWSNIMVAFDQAVAAGPGSTVQFSAGDFYAHRPIQVANFSGTVRGQGKEQTRFHTAPGRLFGLQEYPLPPYPTYMVLYFDGDWPTDQTADVTVSELSFYIDDPSEPWGRSFPDAQFNSMSVINVHGIVRGYLDPDHADFQLTHMNATFQHLKTVAETGSQYLFFGSSILDNVCIQGEMVIELDPATNVILSRWNKPITGTYIFEDIEMYDSFWSLCVINAQDSDIRIGGSQRNRIVARGTGDSVELFDMSNSTVEVSYLDASGVDGGLFLLQGSKAAWGNDLGELVPETLPEPSTFVFHHNHITSDSIGAEWAAFELWNAGGELGQPLGPVVLTNNTTKVKDHEPPFESVFSYFVDNAQVTNSRISGNGVAGIWVEPFGTPATGWLLQGNNLNGLSAALAPIYLGPGTSNCTVIGGNSGDNVLDEGTDNILVGVNNQRGSSPAPDLRAGLARKRAAIRSLR